MGLGGIGGVDVADDARVWIAVQLRDPSDIVGIREGTRARPRIRINNYGKDGRGMVMEGGKEGSPIDGGIAGVNVKRKEYGGGGGSAEEQGN